MGKKAKWIIFVTLAVCSVAYLIKKTKGSDDDDVLSFYDDVCADDLEDVNDDDYIPAENADAGEKGEDC